MVCDDGWCGGGGRAGRWVVSDRGGVERVVGGKIVGQSVVGACVGGWVGSGVRACEGACCCNNCSACLFNCSSSSARGEF